MGRRQTAYLLALILCLALVGGGTGLLRPAMLEQPERFFFDIHYSRVPPPAEQSGIVLVLAGETSFKRLGSWPWSRAYHARLLGNLGLSRGILLDILMPETGPKQADEMLAAVVRTLGNVTMACHLIPDSNGGQHVVAPYPSLLDAAAQVGVTNVQTDTDGYLRAIRPVWMADGGPLAAFPLAGASLLTGVPPAVRETEDGRLDLVLGDRRVPLDDNGMMWVQTATPPITRYEYWDVLNKTIPPETFRDKIVVVGIAASGATDYHLVPGLLGPTEMAGAEFNAKALSTLLWGYVPVRVPPILSGAAALLLALLGGFLGLRRPLRAYVGFFAALCCYPVFTHLLFINRICWLETALPLLAMSAAFLAAHGLRYTFVHRDWQIKTLSINQIAGLDTAAAQKSDNFAELLESLWPHVSGDTGVRLAGSCVDRESLDPRFLAESDDQLTVVHPGPDGMRAGLAIPVPGEKDGRRYVLLGWDRRIEAETLRALTAVILSNAWFYSNLKEATERKSMLFKTIRSIFHALDFRDPITGDHSNRVSSLALEIMERMRLEDEKQVEDIYLGTLVHDVGKIGIPDSVLLKESRLTVEEYNQIKTHPEIGEKIMESVGLPEIAMKTIAEHHERFDGSGYPRRLAGTEISLGGRVAAVADVFDALTSERPYRDGWTKEKACQYIYSKRGTDFDPQVVDILLELKMGEDWKTRMKTANISSKEQKASDKEC